VLFTADPVVVRGARAAAEAADAVVVSTGEECNDPAMIVVDLEQPDAMDHVRSLRSANPDTILVGHLSRPEQERWVAAERAGCDLVANRGSVGRQLKRLLLEGGRRRRFPLVDEADIAGRLGLLARVEQTPVGAVGVYRVDGRVTAIEDRCPHAGGELSAGKLDQCVLTCPLHGSQFHVGTGERLRGPADRDVTLYEVVHEQGRVQLIRTN